MKRISLIVGVEDRRKDAQLSTKTSIITTNPCRWITRDIDDPLDNRTEYVGFHIHSVYTRTIVLRFEMDTGRFDNKSGLFYIATGHFDNKSGLFYIATGHFDNKSGLFYIATGHFDNKSGLFYIVTGHFDADVS